jgi:rhodanese-related sulfurtransferase
VVTAPRPAVLARDVVRLDDLGGAVQQRVERPVVARRIAQSDEGHDGQADPLGVDHRPIADDRTRLLQAADPFGNRTGRHRDRAGQLRVAGPAVALQLGEQQRIGTVESSRGIHHHHANLPLFHRSNRSLAVGGPCQAAPVHRSVVVMTLNAVLAMPPAAPAVAAAVFAARLALQTDVADVHSALALPEPGFVLIDSRADAAWHQGHIPGAVHLPTALVAGRAATLLELTVPVVTYCWGPGCNGATRAALALSLAGYGVKEMIGGVEYWIREGLPLRTPQGEVTTPVDPLVAPCGC